MKRQYCQRCAYPTITCVCKAIDKVILPIRVVILQHEKESKHAKNTARLAKLASPEIEIVKLTNSIAHADLISSIDRTTAIVLYPNNSSITLESYKKKIISLQLNAEHLHEKVTLILIDASWRQAYGIWQQNTWLKDLTHCHFGKVPEQRYLIRKSKKTHQLSTIEALAQSVEILCGISGQAYISLFIYMQKYWTDFKD